MLTVFVRTIILYAVIVLSIRLMGKRQIGELEPSELVVTVLISELAAIPMQDIGVPLFSGILPVLTLVSLEMLMSLGIIKSPRFRALMSGKPSIVIKDGLPVQSAMKKNCLTIDELCEELRQQGFTDMRKVKYAILETGGKLSVLPFAAEQPVTPSVMNIKQEEGGLFTLIINDGRLLENNMSIKGFDDKWLEGQLGRLGAADVKNVFLLAIDEQNNIQFAAKDKNS